MDRLGKSSCKSYGIRSTKILRFVFLPGRTWHFLCDGNSNPYIYLLRVRTSISIYDRWNSRKATSESCKQARPGFHQRQVRDIRLFSCRKYLFSGSQSPLTSNAWGERIRTFVAESAATTSLIWASSPATKTSSWSRHLGQVQLLIQGN